MTTVEDLFVQHPDFRASALSLKKEYAQVTHFDGSELIALFKGEKVVVTKSPLGYMSVSVGGIKFTEHCFPHLVGTVVRERRHIGLFE